jgi:hypothetical protein
MAVTRSFKSNFYPLYIIYYIFGCSRDLRSMKFFRALIVMYLVGDNQDVGYLCSVFFEWR